MITAGEFLIFPSISKFKYPIKSYSQDRIFSWMKRCKFPDFEINSIDLQVEPGSFPFEIGKFLIDELTVVLTNSIEDAIKLKDEYNTYDLNKVVSSLNESVIDHKIDHIDEDIESIEEICNNVWNDVDIIKKRIDGVTHGVSMSIGAVGSVAEEPTLKYGGFLAGLGIEILEKFTKIKPISSSMEKLMRYTSPNYICNIFDFKKKYNLFK